MRLILFILLSTSAAFADQCQHSARAFWSVSCENPQLQMLIEEVDRLQTAARDNPLQHPGTRAAIMVQSEAALADLDACLGSDDPEICLRNVAMGRIGGLWHSGHVPDGYVGQSRAPEQMLCAAFAQPLQVVRVDADPTLLWLSLPYGAILERDFAARNVVYGGIGPEGTIDLGITPAGQVVLTGLSDRPSPCYLTDVDFLR